MNYSEKDITNALNFSKIAYTNFEDFIKNSINFSSNISKAKFEDTTVFDKWLEFQNKIGNRPNLEKNIFSALTPKMHHENVHSRILSFLLNSDSLLMQSFLEMLANSKDAKDKKLNIDLENYKNVLSECEKLKIDVSIKDEESKHAIVIENKINEAVDQEKQMYRYLTKLKEKVYTVDAIVYLVPSVSKNPDYSTYEEQEKEDVEKLFIKLIGYDGSNNDLCSNFIDKEYKELDVIIKSNLKQYGDLLKDKGVVTMNEPIIEKFYEELMKSEENYKNALFVQEMMNNLDLFRIKKLEIIFKDVNLNLFKGENMGDYYYLKFNSEKTIGKDKILFDGIYFYFDYINIILTLWTNEQDETGFNKMKTFLASLNLDIKQHDDGNGNIGAELCRFDFIKEQDIMIKFIKKIDNFLYSNLNKK